MRVRQSVRVTKAKHPRLNDVGYIEKLIGTDKKGENPKKVIVKFDTPDPDGELVEFAVGDVELSPSAQ